jgi:hypothetical protein
MCFLTTMRACVLFVSSGHWEAGAYVTVHRPCFCREQHITMCTFLVHVRRAACVSVAVIDLADLAARYRTSPRFMSRTPPWTASCLRRPPQYADPNPAAMSALPGSAHLTARPSTPWTCPPWRCRYELWWGPFLGGRACSRRRLVTRAAGPRGVYPWVVASVARLLGGGGGGRGTRFTTRAV